MEDLCLFAYDFVIVPSLDMPLKYLGSIISCM